MESISAILVTLGIFKSLASNVQSNVVVKVIQDCSFALDTYQALDSNFSLHFLLVSLAVVGLNSTLLWVMSR